MRTITNIIRKIFIKMNKSLILSKIKNHYGFKSDADFARFLKIKPQTLSSWYSRNSFDIDLLYAKCVDIDANWLLTGKGEMLKEEDNVVSEPGASYGTVSESTKSLEKKYISLLEEKIKVLEKEKQFLEKEINAFKSRLSKYEADRQKELVEQHQK